MSNEELKQRQSVVWGNGSFERIAATIADVHDLIVERLETRPGERWLDLACGTGAVAERAAAAGASVVGVDLAPALIETAKRRAAELGLAIDYEVGDCEQLSFGDGSFDIVSSSFGIMFAPDHEAAARELARVVAPGGRIALTCWTPKGAVGRLLGVVAPFQPSLPPSNPVDWGREEHLEHLLGEAFELHVEEHVTTRRYASAEEHWHLFATDFGPIKTLVGALGDRREELHRAWVDFFESELAEDGEIVDAKEYLLVLGTRR